MQPKWTSAEFYVNLRILIHWHTCKSLLNTLGRAVEQLAVCLAKQAKVSSRGQSTTVVQSQHKALKCLNIRMDHLLT